METTNGTAAGRQPPSLFICHSHRDKRFARRLVRHLSALDVPVWIDDWCLSVGDSLHGCIGRAINESAFVAVVVSPNSVASHWCQDELEQALAREKRDRRKVVLPLLYRQVTPPPFLEGRLHLDFSRSYWQSLAQLSAVVHGLDQRVVFERIQHDRPQDIAAVRGILQASGLSPAIPLPAGEYVQLMQILQKAGLEVGYDRIRLILSERVAGEGDNGIASSVDQCSPARLRAVEYQDVQCVVAREDRPVVISDPSSGVIGRQKPPREEPRSEANSGAAEKTHSHACPKCGMETQCLAHDISYKCGVDYGAEYTHTCNACGWSETEQKHESNLGGGPCSCGYLICPFCHKSYIGHCDELLDRHA